MTGVTLRRTGPHLLLAFAGMGAWALIANRAHPWPDMMLAWLVQGTLSAGLTLTMKRLVERVVRYLAGWPAVAVAPLACSLLSVSLLTATHMLTGTPEVATTVAVPVAVSTAYAAAYAAALIQTDRRAKP